MGLFDALPAPKRPAEGEPEAAAQRDKSARTAEPEGKAISPAEAPAAVPGGSARPPSALAAAPLPGIGTWIACRTDCICLGALPTALAERRRCRRRRLSPPSCLSLTSAQQQQSPPSPTWTRLKRRMSRSHPRKRALARSRRRRSSRGAMMCRRRRRRQQTRPAGRTTRCRLLVNEVFCLIILVEPGPLCLLRVGQMTSCGQLTHPWTTDDDWQAGQSWPWSLLLPTRPHCCARHA